MGRTCTFSFARPSTTGVPSGNCVAFVSSTKGYELSRCSALAMAKTPMRWSDCPGSSCDIITNAHRSCGVASADSSPVEKSEQGAHVGGGEVTCVVATTVVQIVVETVVTVVVGAKV